MGMALALLAASAFLFGVAPGLAPSVFAAPADEAASETSDEGVSGTEGESEDTDAAKSEADDPAKTEDTDATKPETSDTAKPGTADVENPAPTAAEPETIAVTDIELDDYKDRMATGETQELAPTVLPANATEQTVAFTSSDKGVLTVSSKGQVKAVGAGTATVTLKAGVVTREIAIEVRVATTAIEVALGFLVLAPEEAFTLTASVAPADAPQALTFRSTNTDVASVSEGGTVWALATGTASIVVSNGDASAVTTVLVNERVAGGANGVDGADGEATAEPSASENAPSPSAAAEAALVAEIESDGGTVRVRQADWPVVTKAVLKALYATGATLVLEAPTYTLTLRGQEVRNEQNELSTSVSFKEDGSDTVFSLNRGEALPGKVEVELTDPRLDRARLYLLNPSTGAYQELASKTGPVLVLDEPGEYRLTDEEIGALTIEPLLVAAAALAILVGVALFVAFRRRYWFW
jgi:hypothetical protein